MPAGRPFQRRGETKRLGLAERPPAVGFTNSFRRSRLGAATSRKRKASGDDQQHIDRGDLRKVYGQRYE